MELTQDYTDLISIFEELEIPWQHWFMIMEESEAIDSDLKAAFGMTSAGAR